MRIQNVCLQNYKRFADLQVIDLPDAARLIVLIGPNGVGKSSLFDAFLYKSRYAVDNYTLEPGYYFKTDTSGQPNTTIDLWQTINIDFHADSPSTPDEWRRVFNVRTSYRNEPDFQVSRLEAVPPAAEAHRFSWIIDSDPAVSDDYKRLTWKRLTDLDKDAPEATTFGDYRATAIRDLQTAITDLFPDLRLQDFGGLTGKGGFRFAKGMVDDFQYKNLSGGEKAAFDLLLDVFVKRDEYSDSVYCIDEPEAHIAVGIQGRLLESLMELLPDKSQLWIATHSIGFIRAAAQRSKTRGDVVFLDFANRDFDQPVVLRPKVTGRSFWQNVYQVALDDLAALVGPDRIILCEGSRDEPRHGFDAKCYNDLFEESHGDTLFLSRGSAGQVEQSDNLISIINAIAEGVEVIKLIDRDDMTDAKRMEYQTQDNVRVLQRRELENYLYDISVLQTLYNKYDRGSVSSRVRSLLPEPVAGDTKAVRRPILIEARKDLSGISLGNTCQEFELSHLVTALKATEAVYRELETDIFGR